MLAVVTGVYTIAGGLRAVIWTELLQLSVLVAGGLALSVVTFQKVGGASAVDSFSLISITWADSMKLQSISGEGADAVRRMQREPCVTPMTFR